MAYRIDSMEDLINLACNSVLIMVIGAALILAGTYYISKSLFLTTLARQYWLRDRYSLELKWKIAGRIFGINEQNWAQVFMSDDQLSPDAIKKVRDYFAHIRGFVFIVLGTSLQLVVWLLF